MNSAPIADTRAADAGRKVGEYRPEIDGIRAIAVLAVIFFHFGWLPQGFLGVDVFFVISGYLITAIIVREWQSDTFSLAHFYMRRARRILPLAMVVASAALAVGSLVMLPDDLENLAQSTIASNLFSNNILQILTTKNYWDVVNEYKPLMHTWSLGIEEQYYFLYPLILLLIPRTRRHLFATILVVLSTVSLIAYLCPFPDFQKFYLLPFRIFELGAGGLAAIFIKRKLSGRLAGPALVLLVLLLTLAPSSWPAEPLLLVIVCLTVLLLAVDIEPTALAKKALQNGLMVGLGKISFSLYMWHQPYLAFARYFVFEDLGARQLLVLALLTGATSLLSYRFIEQPFRDRKRTSNRAVLLFLGTLFVVSSTAATGIYLHSGVVKDVPELGLDAGNTRRGVHAAFNHQIYGWDKDFVSQDRIRTLVLGNSFARDWANVLLATPFASKLEISYIHDYKRETAKLQRRAREADIIFVSTPPPDIHDLLNVDRDRVYAVGTKNFGRSNGYFFNRKGQGYLLQRARADKEHVEANEAARKLWGMHYINFFEHTLDEKGRVPVFTPNGQFISQDCRHLTTFGADYFAQVFDDQLKLIFDLVQERKKTNLDNHP